MFGAHWGDIEIWCYEKTDVEPSYSACLLSGSHLLNMHLMLNFFLYGHMHIGYKLHFSNIIKLFDIFHESYLLWFIWFIFAMIHRLIYICWVWHCWIICCVKACYCCSADVNGEWEAAICASLRCPLLFPVLPL